MTETNNAWQRCADEMKTIVALQFPNTPHETLYSVVEALMRSAETFAGYEVGIAVRDAESAGREGYRQIEDEVDELKEKLNA